LALGVFGLLGFSGRRDHHQAQLALLEELAPHWDEDWWFLGYLGWAYIETGEVAKGMRLVERSLAGNLRNAHAAHQRVHGFFEAGDAAGGAAFINDWLKGYDRAGQLHCHLSWHLALSASFLWRWQFYGAAPSLEQEWAEVAAHARQHFPRASLAFADLHAALAEAAIGDDDGVGSRVAGLESLARDGRLPSGGVAPALCAGAAALARGDHTEAARLLEAALDDLPRIGGSHAQREVAEDSLIVALLGSGQGAKAARLLRSRLDRRPSARDEGWLSVCSAGPG
jgi:tetratricopeptide (TPR) repeat protein